MILLSSLVRCAKRGAPRKRVAAHNLATRVLRVRPGSS